MSSGRDADDRGHAAASPSRRRLLRRLAGTGVGAASLLVGVSRSHFGINSVLAALPAPFLSDGGQDKASGQRPALPPYSFNPSLRDLAEWDEFKRRFIIGGRVIDTGNRGVSHTEGQGWGMLFAVAFNDRRTFDALWSWTDATLRRPDGALHAWRYDPSAAVPIADWNNATDGDLFIAGALGRAARRWGDPAHADAARAIANDVRARLVRVVGGRTVLLPGLSGFEDRDATIVNPSYYAFPMLAELGAYSPSPSWATIMQDGVRLISESRFGRWGLPPDWLRVDARRGTVAPAPGWPARFSFDAVRVPLYLAWSRCLPWELGDAFRSYWSSPAGSAAWVDLQTGDAAPFAAPAGMRAINQFVTQGGDEPSVRVPVMAAAQDYYSAALLLLTRVAWREASHVQSNSWTQAT